ncbi:MULTISPECIES: sugar ABC transporter permease [unclassified Nocardioides]|uniref:sugar ABC transporter permease n=1 Tax=unclassified Nocardioides TaxID=2615069 RepID=UPI0006F2C3CC|nr:MULTISPECIES: ABC transporter permease [unclassified Nocardioides]KRA38332.1 ABC transporter permease [Nocardioides sp. Root614]KRA92291.1 ABC transporter permease [Nocardioides sp. Root682]
MSISSAKSTSEKPDGAPLAGGTSTVDPSDVDRPLGTVRDAFVDYLNRLRGGDMGALPAILGLVVLFTVFSVLHDKFLTTYNMANLVVQAGSICVLAMGLVFVLLLGEIDLSAGVAGGASATITALMLVDHGWTWWGATLAGIAIGAVIGLVIGLLVAYLSIPSFVVTLAFFLALQAVPLKLIGAGGSLRFNDEILRGLSIKNVPVVAGWVAALVVVVGFAALALWRYHSRSKRGLSHRPLLLVLIQIVALAVIVLGSTALLSQNRAPNPDFFNISGIPWVAPVVIVLLLVWTFVLTRTKFGRHLYAVGGNAEAARRAGINVNAMKVAAFVICSSMAAVSGILAASYTGKVSPGSGGGNELLYAVGAAVIGGTSLFGGRGRALDAVIGGLVIATIPNGLGLLDQASYINFIVTGGVLLLAASVDAISRRRRSATGV